MKQRLPSPLDPEVVERCKLDFSERDSNRQLYDLHIDLLALKREQWKGPDEWKRSLALLACPLRMPTRYVLEKNSNLNLRRNYLELRT